MSRRTLISGGTVVTVDQALDDLPRGDVLVEDGAIVEVAPRIDAADAERIDAADCLVLPGLVDTHRHTWQALFRNIASDWTLAHYFTGLHGTLSGLYRPEDTYAGNLIGALEALDGGITTLLDWSHNLNTPEHTDAAVDAVVESCSDTAAATGTGSRSARCRIPPTTSAAFVRAASPPTTRSSRCAWHRAATSSPRWR